MKWTLLLAIVAAFVVPAGAHSAVPCRDKIYNEWYSTGKISTNYPTSCYRDALKNIPPDAKVYSNLGGDIQAAMQAAVTHSGPSAVGSGPSGPSGPHQVKGKSKSTTSTRTSSLHPMAIAPLASSPSGGVPTPILALGALAILLAVVGLVGAGVQQARKRQRRTA